MLPILSIDGAVIAIVQDVVKKSRDDPDILKRFSDELSHPHNGTPRHVVAIRALNSVYGTGIPEDSGAPLRSYLNDILEKRVGPSNQGTLTLGIGIDVGFLELLAKIGQDRIEFVSTYLYDAPAPVRQP